MALFFFFLFLLVEQMNGTKNRQENKNDIKKIMKISCVSFLNDGMTGFNQVFFDDWIIFRNGTDICGSKLVKQNKHVLMNDGKKILP